MIIHVTNKSISEYCVYVRHIQKDLKERSMYREWKVKYLQMEKVVLPYKKCMKMRYFI